MLSINTCKVFCRGGVAAAFASSMAIRPSHSSPLVVTPLLALSDNYIYLLHNTQTGETAVVDPSTSDAVIAFLAGEKLELQTILVTHKHWDHTNGIKGLVEHFPGAQVIAPALDAPFMKGIQVDHKVADADEITVVGRKMISLGVPGHTLGSTALYFPDDKVIFTGDTLFSVGCGRVFEGSMDMMSVSMKRLAALPGDVLMFCGHEYTEGNLRFALTVDGGNRALHQRAEQVRTLRQSSLPTIPVLMETELKTNPFLRCGDPSIRAKLGFSDSTDDVTVFGELRSRKDSFS